jgi:hypothetical protein
MTVPAAVHAHPAPADHFHLVLGDFPAWLLVIGAGITAWVALLQFTRQTRQLERQQADKIAVLRRLGEAYPPNAGEFPAHVVDVANESQRPIRNVTALIEPEPGKHPYPPTQVVLTAVGQGGQRHERDRRDDSSIPLVRPRVIVTFTFPVTDQFTEPRVTVKFTDDAGLHWEIDEDLRLRNVGRRWWRRLRFATG